MTQAQRDSKMRVDEFNYELPEELIAQTPLNQRDQSRLLIVDPVVQQIEHSIFSSIYDHLQPGDVLVRNNTRVIPARLVGIKELTLAHVELLLLHQEGDTWECLVGNAKVVKLGTRILFGEGRLVAECIAIGDEGIRVFRMMYSGVFLEVLDELGQVPLPPYIHEQLDDRERYQTVYAKESGSAAAPTAGLHFTPELINALEQKGVEFVDVTLHIGLGTFRPVKVDTVESHPMHEEYYVVTSQAASQLNRAKEQGKRIIAIGTTAMRVIETQMQRHSHFVAESAATKIFIYPGYQFKGVDALITNFHLPKSTLVMLVCAFGGQAFMLNVYKEAVAQRYRFFSFGDSMFLTRHI